VFVFVFVYKFVYISIQCFKHIASKLGKNQTTISKKVKAHLIYSSQNFKKDSNGQLISCPLLSKPPYVSNLSFVNLFPIILTDNCVEFIIT